jgi:hypothetical protein
MTNRKGLLLVPLVVVLLLLSWVAVAILGQGWFLMDFTLVPRPNPTASAFYAACKDLEAVQQRASAAGGFTLEATSSNSNGVSSGPGRMNAHAEQAGAVQCRPEDLGKVLPALKAEFQRLARENGAAMEEAGEEKDPAGNLTDFTLRYTAGRGHGQVQATLGEGKPVPDKPGLHRYPLTVKVEESVP